MLFFAVKRTVTPADFLSEYQDSLYLMIYYTVNCLGLAVKEAGKGLYLLKWSKR